MHAIDDTPDYVWHFRLSAAGTPGADEDALPEMVREQVAALLRCVTFTSNGVSVRVTGFRFLDQPELDHLVGTSIPSLDESAVETLADEAACSPLGDGECG